MTKIISGVELAKKVRSDINKKATLLREEGIIPTLAVILVGDNKASTSYVNAKHKACLENNINSVILKTDESITTDELLLKIEKLNNDDTIHGILVQLPLPKHIDEEKVLLKISPSKDVDGFNPINVGKLSQGSATLVPCTPLGIMSLIKEAFNDLEGMSALVIGRSNIVGKPVANLLLKENATVTVAHSKTKNLKNLIACADIIVSCVGRAHFLNGEEEVKENALIVDVGNNYLDGKLVGDVKLDNFLGKISYITPVPGGVGPMTITMLMNNTLVAVENLKK